MHQQVKTTKLAQTKHPIEKVGENVGANVA